MGSEPILEMGGNQTDEDKNISLTHSKTELEAVG